jgi:glycosyltransferase involved in cell wall biosynthesis
MTKILRIIASADPRSGGPIEGIRRAAQVLTKIGHLQDILTLDTPGDDLLPDYPGNIFRIGTPRSRDPRTWYRYSPRLIPWLRTNAAAYDAIIVEGLWRYTARGAMKALVRGPTPYFVFTHGMLDPWFRQSAPLKHWAKQISWWFAEGRLLSHARNVLFTTEDERRLAEKSFWPYRINGAIVGYGTADVSGDPANQIAAFRMANPAIKDRSFLLFLSRIHPKKGCDLLIEAFAQIAHSHPSLDLVIAGPDEVGLVPALRVHAERLRISDRVHFPGMLEGDVKYGAFRAAEAFVLTSHQENFGVVVAEAMACEKPVLISDKVNIYHEVLADEAGLVEPDTIKGAARLLTRFMAMSKAERDAMGTRARASFERRFHIDNIAQSLMTFIEQRI